MMFRILGFEGVGVLCVLLAYLVVGGGFGVVADGLRSPYVSLLVSASVFIPTLVWTAILGMRFFRERRRLSMARERLELEMSELTEQIRSRYQQQRDAEKKEALDCERQRIMRDVHDGLGGLLIQAVALAEQPAHTNELREVLSVALHDLRLIVNSLSPTEGNLGELLSTFRHFHNRARGSDRCRYEWFVGDLCDVRLEPSQSMSILRVMQEALTNVAKHARATRVRIHIGKSGPQELRFLVEDNGIGFGEHGGTGRGVASMRQRAAELHGDLSIQSTPAGTRVQMVIPIGCGERRIEPPLRKAFDERLVTLRPNVEREVGNSGALRDLNRLAAHRAGSDLRQAG